MNDRVLKHSFSSQFFHLQTLELNLEFHVVRKEPIKEIVLVEKHFFGDKVLSEFEFVFPFCIGGSTNTWQYVYDLPKLTLEQQKEMIKNPFKTCSDSFFFADGKLIIHNKASYAYKD